MGQDLHLVNRAVQLKHTRPLSKLVLVEPAHRVEESGGTGVAPCEQMKSWIVCCVEDADPSVTYVQLRVEKAACSQAAGMLSDANIT